VYSRKNKLDLSSIVICQWVAKCLCIYCLLFSLKKKKIVVSLVAATIAKVLEGKGNGTDIL